MIRVIEGDCREALKALPDASVQCCVTSPPYFGLRDYGVVGQIGLEASPDLFVAEMVAVFREVRRVLRDDGTLWLNLGDSYARNPAKGGSGPNGKHDFIPSYGDARRFLSESRGSSDGKVGRGDRAAVRNGGDQLKEKDLMMIPARVALALQTDGWWLRSDIIWHKPNPMPESVNDRPTTAHEHVFLLTKSARYFYDAEAITEPASPNTHARLSQDLENQIGSFRANGGAKSNGPMKAVGGKTAAAGSGIKHNTSYDSAVCLRVSARNSRSVWTIPTHSFSEAHFATFPPALAERCIKAGSKPGDVILDPFAGAFTSLLVADRLQRDGIGIELNPDYCAMARKRLTNDAPLFAEVAS